MAQEEPIERFMYLQRFGNFPEEQYCIEPDILRRLLSSGTYVVSKDKECLYVGSAKNVMARISDESHDSFRMALCQATQVMVKMSPTEHDARHFEARMIAVRQPKYNKVGKSKATELWRQSIVADEFEESFREELTKNLAKLDCSHKPTRAAWLSAGAVSQEAGSGCFVND